MDVLIGMRDYFLEKQVQLYIYNNNQYLLEEKDGEFIISFIGEMLFTFFAQFAESEMKDKRDRMKRGKIAKRNDLKYIGGKIPFGYKVNRDKNNIIEIDKKDANIVRGIYNDYEKGLSYGSIGKTLMLRGEIPSTNIKSATMFISQIINRKQYTGEDVGSYILPQIISKKQFDRCQEISNNKNKPKTNIKNIYWCKNLIKVIDEKTGKERTLSPVKGTGCYTYIDNELKTISININLIDSLTWHITKTHRMESSSYDAEKEAAEAQKIHDDAEKKLKQCDVRIEKLKKEKERWLQMYIKGKISEERYDKEDYKIDYNIDEIGLEKDKYNHTMTVMMNRIIYATSFFYEKKINDDKTDEEIFDIIQNDIEKIIISKINKKYKFNVVYYFKNGITNKFEICSSNLNRYVKDENNKNIQFKMFERFKRKQY